MTGGPHSRLLSLGRPNVLKPTADCSSLGLSCAASLPPLPFGPMADGLNGLSICHDLLEKNWVSTSVTLLKTAIGLVGLQGFRGRWKVRMENMANGNGYIFKYHSFHWPPLWWKHTSRFWFFEANLFFSLFLGADQIPTWVQLLKCLWLWHFVHCHIAL